MNNLTASKWNPLSRSANSRERSYIKKNGNQSHLHRSRSIRAFSEEIDKMMSERLASETGSREEKTSLPIRNVLMETVHEDDVPAQLKSSSPQPRTTPSLEQLMFEVPRASLLEVPTLRLVQVIHNLRREVLDRRVVKVPPRTSSRSKDKVERAELPTSLWPTKSEGEEAIPIDLKGLQLEISKIEDMLGEERAKNDKIEASLQKNTQLLAEAMTKLDLLRNELKTEKRIVKEIEADNEHNKQECEMLERELNDQKEIAKKTLRELALLTQTKPNYFDDNHFREQVEQMGYNVRNWVRNQEWLVARSAKKQHLIIYHPFRGTCSRYPDYVVTENGLKIFMEAHIWRFLRSKVFDRNLWAESTCINFEHDSTDNMYTIWKRFLEKKAPDANHVELRNESRVANAQLIMSGDLGSENTDVEKVIRNLVCDLDEALKPITTKRLDWQGLEGLIQDAVKLDALIQQQRQVYTFFPRVYADPKLHRFDPSMMESINEDTEVRGRQVQLVVRFGLRKFGNSAGRNYEQKIEIVKALVDLERP